MVAASSTGTVNESNTQLSRDETKAELEKLWDEYRSQISRTTAVQIGAIYARYSTRFQSSIVDQVRADLEFALKNQIWIPFENILFDLAISGRKANRAGLLELRKCLNDKSVQVLIVFTTNRFFPPSNESPGVR